jgi:hypothetical protein
VEQEEVVFSPAMGFSPHQFLSHRQLGRSSSMGAGFLLGAQMVEFPRSKGSLIARIRTFVLTIVGFLQADLQRRVKMQIVRTTFSGFF